MTSKCSQKLFDHAKKSAEDALKTASNRPIQKTGEATCDLIGNKIAFKITTISKTLPQNNSLEKDMCLQKIDIKLLMI